MSTDNQFGVQKMLSNLTYGKKEGVFKELFTMWIVEFEGWLTAITNIGKFNIIFHISSIGGLLAITTNLEKFQEWYLTII